VIYKLGDFDKIYQNIISLLEIFYRVVIMQKMHKQYKFLNLLFLGPRMPITAKISILHRISGVLLLVCLPCLLFMVHQLKNDTSYYSYLVGSDMGYFYKLVLTIFMWAILHHLFAGIRHLLLDLHIGIRKSCANSSAWIVLIITLAVTAVMAYLIWY
jgi:succinate dehydrogenase / fumarate reductase cytochrome b subunit